MPCYHSNCCVFYFIMPFDKEGKFRSPTEWEESWSRLMDIWIGLVQAREYDRITSYILKRSGEGKKSVAGDVLTGAKQLAMNVRRGVATAGGVAVGLAATGVLPEIVGLISPTVAIVSVAAFGLNFGIDKLMDMELEGNK